MRAIAIALTLLVWPPPSHAVFNNRFDCRLGDVEGQTIVDGITCPPDRSLDCNVRTSCVPYLMEV